METRKILIYYFAWLVSEKVVAKFEADFHGSLALTTTLTGPFIQGKIRCILAKMRPK